MKLDDIVIKTNEETVYWMMENGLIASLLDCDGCNMLMRLTKTSRNKDGLAWRCFKKDCRLKNTWISVRKGSFFEHTTTNLKEILKVIYLWSNQMISKDILKYMCIGESTLLKLKLALIELIRNYFDKYPLLLGGPGRIVQIDETMLNHKVKAHRGRVPKKQVWTLGIADCSYKPAKGGMWLIENKKSETILAIIEKHVRKKA